MTGELISLFDQSPALAGRSLALPPPPAGWPAPPDPVAYHGLPGAIVAKIAPHTEADPAAILVQLLVCCGALIGRDAFFQVEATHHHPNEFVVLVGDSAKARKGSSFDHVARLLSQADPAFTSRQTTGLSSGEGLIWAVRDPHGPDPGALDKRLLVIEPEFATVSQVRPPRTLDALANVAHERNAGAASVDSGLGPAGPGFGRSGPGGPRSGGSSSAGGSSGRGILRWISTRQPLTRTCSTTSRSSRWRPSKSSPSSEAAIRSVNPARRRRSRFWVASSALRAVRVSLSWTSWPWRAVSALVRAGELSEFHQAGLVGVEQPGALARSLASMAASRRLSWPATSSFSSGAPASTARSPASSCWGSSSAWRTCPNTYSSSASARM